jgi:hypothetical protein
VVALAEYGVPVELLECAGSDEALRLLEARGHSAAA